MNFGGFAVLKSERRTKVTGEQMIYLVFESVVVEIRTLVIVNHVRSAGTIREKVSQSGWQLRGTRPTDSLDVNQH